MMTVGASYHVAPLLEPGEGEWRVSAPLAVEADVGVHVHRLGLRLHQ